MRNRSLEAFVERLWIQAVPWCRAPTVSARQIETGLTRTAVTDRVGAYVVLELPVGHYEVQVEAKGFQKYIQQGIVLDVNETANVPVRLSVGAETEQVQVHADAQLIESGVTSLGKTVSEREVLDLPLNGRNFTQLGLLQPGVVPLTPGLAEAGGSLREGQAYAVNGQRPESNNFLIDGANNFNGVDGGFVLKPPVDAITEFRILTHNAGAEFGQSLGSTTNIITRSGTNRFHGALWEFLRNDAFDATNYFAARTEPLKQNQFGATFGGPIRKDKTFFFAYFEGFQNRQGKRRRQPCHQLQNEMVTSRRYARKGSRQAFATTRITSCSTSSSASPIPTTSIPSIPKPIRFRKISCSTSRSPTRDQRVYHDPSGATGLEPGRRENRSLPHTV